MARVTIAAVLGRSVPRVEGRRKVTGQARYVDDFALPGMTRNAHVLFSTPAVESVGAQKPGIKRVYEFTVGATMASSSGISFCWPPMKWRMVSLI